MRTIEVISTDVEKAIEKGLLMLDTTMENVVVNVIDKGSMLKKAKIEMTYYEQGEERIAPEPKKEVKKVTTKSLNKTINKDKIVEKSSILKNEDNLPYNEEDSKKAQALCKEYMEGFLKAYKCEYTLDIVEENKDIIVSVNGDKMGGLIGHHGDTLNSLQYLLNLYIKEHCPSYERRVYLDIENYRNKRETTLKEMANRLAGKVLQNKRSIKLEPMNRYERKIIHTVLQGMEHIDTHSEGKDPDRYLVIDYIS